MAHVSTDIVGKFQQLGLKDEHYLAVYVDHHSGYIAVYPMQKKSDVLNTLKKFHLEHVVAINIQ